MKVLASLALVGMAMLGMGTSAPLAGAVPGSGSSGSVAISSPTVAGPCQRPAGSCTSVTVPAATAVDATFDTTPVPLVITNTGSTDLTDAAISFAAAAKGAASIALEKQLNVCVQGSGHTVVVNGPLSRGLSLTPSTLLTGPSLSPGSSTRYRLSFYAGEDSACGKVVSSDPRTAAAWSSPPFAFTASYDGTGTYVTPPSLTNPAENGTVTVTVAIDVASTVRVTPTTGASSNNGSSTTAVSNNGGASGTRSTPVATAAASSSLAFTGADIATTTIGGLLALLLGLFLVLVSRRRRSQATGDAAP